MKLTPEQVDTFTRAYIECALWSSTDDNGDPLDSSDAELSTDAQDKMENDCRDFCESFGPYIERDLTQAGHDFWLTRNGHGCGFWDGDWKEDYEQLGERHPPVGIVPQYRTVGDYLTAMSKPYGSVDLYVGDDGAIYGS